MSHHTTSLSIPVLDDYKSVLKKEYTRPLHQSNNVVETIAPPVITIFIGGMVTIPKWVVYDTVLTK
jgi:hypothetical protein